MWFIGVEVEKETSAPPPERNPGSAPGSAFLNIDHINNNNKCWKFCLKIGSLRSWCYCVVVE